MMRDDLTPVDLMTPGTPRPAVVARVPGAARS
jgi:hypothetical protein